MDFDFTLPGLERPASSRPKRVAEAIHHEFSLLLLQEVADPRLRHVTISHVRVSADLRQARIYYVLSQTGAGEKREAARALERARGFFRSHLARTLNLRRTPQLSFHFDPMDEEAARVEALLAEIGEQERQGNE